MTDSDSSGMADFIPDEAQPTQLGVGISALLRDADTQDVNVYKTLTHHSDLQESELYDDYRVELFENPIAALLVRHIVAELATGYRFEGPSDKVDLVKKFWFFANMDQKLEQVTLQGVLLGTGGGDIVLQGDELAGFERLDSATLVGERDTKGKETWKQNGKKLNLDKLFLLRLLEYPDQVYGMSFLRPNLKSLQGLGNLVDDVPAAVKRLAYLERKLALDLADVKDATKKANIVKAAQELWQNYNSATTQLIALDKRHELSYVGTDGGNQTRMVPMMDIIEPVLSFVMLNFFMALGHIQQTGANKALLKEQEKRAKRAIGFLRKKWAAQVERQIIARILGINLKEVKEWQQLPDIEVRIVYDQDEEDLREERRVLLQEWTQGLITRTEYRLSAGRLALKDDGDKPVFIYDTPLGKTPEAGGAQGGPKGGAEQKGKSKKDSEGSSTFTPDDLLPPGRPGHLPDDVDDEEEDE